MKKRLNVVKRPTTISFKELMTVQRLISFASFGQNILILLHRSTHRQIPDVFASQKKAITKFLTLPKVPRVATFVANEILERFSNECRNTNSSQSQGIRRIQ